MMTVSFASCFDFRALNIFGCLFLCDFSGFDDITKKRKILSSEKPCPKRFKRLHDSDVSSSRTNPFAQHFMRNLSAGYDALLQVFHYLKVQELLRAARVCRMWRDLAGHPTLVSTFFIVFLL